MANKKNTQKTHLNADDVMKVIFGPIIIVLAVAGGIYGFVHDRSQNKKYGELKYEDLGSTFHLIGGLSTEQKYHIIYRYRVTNRPDDDDNMKWSNGETTVSGSRYRELKVGQTLYDDTPFFPY